MRAETQIQFINFSQEEIAELISKSVKSQFDIKDKICFDILY